MTKAGGRDKILVGSVGPREVPDNEREWTKSEGPYLEFFAHGTRVCPHWLPSGLCWLHLDLTGGYNMTQTDLAGSGLCQSVHLVPGLLWAPQHSDRHLNSAQSSFLSGGQGEKEFFR